ncbi:MAG: phosphoribosyltransferase [Candidatus Wildermuthbacteria bacterium]|nr:phosphoribosyltransferase [Candidatus Wildermuthbacteria bacterium]
MQRSPYEVLARVGALLQGHFVLTSGRHAGAYVNKDALYPHIMETSKLCREMAGFADPGTQVVAAPAIGGVILSQWVSHHLGVLLGTEVLAVYAEPGPDDTLVFKRGYDQLIPGKRVLVIEDVLTTGGSAKKVVDAVRALGGDVLGVCVLSNRGGVTVEQLGNVPFLHALTNIPMESWTAEECPLCKEGVPINTEVGKGKEFLARKASVI